MEGFLKGLTRVNEGAIAMGVGEEVEMRGKGTVCAGAEDDAPRLLFSFRGGDVADGEGGVIDARGGGADEDCVDFGSEAMGVEEGFVAGDSGGLSVLEGDFSIERHGAFPDDPRDAGGDAFEEGSVEPESIGFENAPNGFDACIAEDPYSGAGVGGVGVEASDNDAFDARTDDGLGAGWGTAVGGTGFEGDVKGGVFRRLRIWEVFESLDFCMGLTCGPVPSVREDGVVAGDDGADGGVGGGEADAALGLCEGGLHEEGILGAGFARVGKVHGSAPSWSFAAEESRDGVEVVGLDGDGVLRSVGGCGGCFGRELEGFDSDDGGFFLETASDADGGTGCVIEPEAKG